MKKIPNKVQLIIYADSLGGSLKALGEVLEKHFPGMFAALHILPPFPSSGDRGFAPIDYRQIDPAFGSWADIQALSEKHLIMLDLMVNHVSRQSSVFRDYLARGEKSPYAEFFLSPRKLWGADEVPKEDLKKIVLRRERPWSDYLAADGETVRVWTTFGAEDPSEQIDLDVQNPEVRCYFENLFDFFGKNGVGVLRLDAVGYAIKKPGTSCFLVEPEIYEFLDWAQSKAAEHGVAILSEIHSTVQDQRRLADAGYIGYDFLLPYAILHSLNFADTSVLEAVMKNRPHNMITMLDCHDGVPMQPDMQGFITFAQAWDMVRLSEQRGAAFTRVHTTEQADPLAPDVHQICATYYDLLGRDDDAYIAARAIQLFVPGIPQVYYVGLLAGENDTLRMNREKEKREINRHNFSCDEIEAALQRPVVKNLLSLIELRNTHAAFDGTFVFSAAQPDILRFEWENGAARCCLSVDVKRRESHIIST